MAKKMNWSSTSNFAGFPTMSKSSRSTCRCPTFSPARRNGTIGPFTPGCDRLDEYFPQTICRLVFYASCARLEVFRSSRADGADPREGEIPRRTENVHF